MASPFLEAGAMDGARGILINITGSSSLKLSEVNEASMLIQSAAHEDANIIFGAVQDEKMGEEVKITVIATGFRDQMPERRKRMLEVEEETPVVSIPLSPAPVAQISLVPRNDGFHEPEAAPVLAPVAVPVAAPKPPRFLSQEEEGEEVTVETNEAEKSSISDNWDEEGFFSDPEPAAVVEPAVEAVAAIEPEEMEQAAMPAPPRFAELAEEPAYTPPPRAYAPAFNGGVRGRAAVEEKRMQPATSLFPETDEEMQPDLEKPTFLRNLQL
jgi:cell division protein FtsZ